MKIQLRPVLTASFVAGGVVLAGLWGMIPARAQQTQAAAAAPAAVAPAPTLPGAGAVAAMSQTQLAAVTAMNTALASLTQAATDARTALASASFGEPIDTAAIKAKVDALAAAELALADARGNAFVRIQESTDKLSPELVQSLVLQSTRGAGIRAGFAGGGGARGGLDAEIARGADFSEKPPILAKTPAEEAKQFLLPPGYRMELVLSEPEIKEPNLVVFDSNGRMFVTEMRSYMQDADAINEKDPISRISMHEDTNGDGIYDRHTVFADNMIIPRFILPMEGNSILTMETDAYEVYKLTDTDGDGVSDKKELWTSNFGRVENLEHEQSGMVWALDNWIYTTYNAYRVRWTPDGVLREPTGANGGQWGLAQDNYGKPWFVDAGGERGPVNFQVPIVYGAMTVTDGFEPGFEVPWGAVMGLADVQGGMARVRMPEGNLNHFTATCGPAIFRGDRLPADMVGDLLFGEPVGRMVRRAKVVVTDGLTQLRNAYPNSEFIRSTDPLFRPINMTTAPDGTLYIVDAYRGIIQEGTWTRPGSYLRRKVEQYAMDKVIGHGRIWRLTYDGIQPDRQPPRMSNETAAQLVAHLNHPNGWWRDTAQRLLVLKQDKAVTPALQAMARTGSQLGKIHALWTLEGLGALDAAMVREQLKNPDPQIRVQAIRLSESLTKDGDKSFEDDVRAASKDSEPNVVIQAMLTLNLQKVPEVAAYITSTIDSNKARGVTEIGTRLMQVGRGARAGTRGGAAVRGGAGAPAAAGGATAPPAAAAPAAP